MNDKQAIGLGKSIADILGLKMNKEGRYNTAWGTKTMQGLGLTVLRLVKEAESEKVNYE